MIAEGQPMPPGATWAAKESGWNFTLSSRHATGMTLLLYNGGDFVNGSSFEVAPRSVVVLERAPSQARQME